MIEDLFARRQELLLDEASLPEAPPEARTVGIPLTMFAIGMLPFWRTMLAGCGFRTVLSDPTNNQLHTVAVGWRRETGSRTLTLDVQLRMGYVNESTLGTEIATSGADGADGGTDWGGTHLQLTSSEIDLITDYTDLQIRCLANTSGGGATTRAQITSIRLLTDGPGVVAATVYPPFPRRQNTLVRM